VKIFVTGATGVLGRAAIPVLTRGGHEVRAMTHGSDDAARVSGSGVEAAQADLFDAGSLGAALAGCDALLHLASKIPAPPAARRRSAWEANDRIRREGTRNLVEAALASGVGVLVYPSVIFLYRDADDAWVEMGAPLDPPPILASDLDAEAEVARFAAAGGRGVVLRLGQLYGPDNPATAALLQAAREGTARVFGRAEAYQSSIHADDAAAAFRAALEGTLAGIYDLVDDEPLRRREVAAVLAQIVGRSELERPDPHGEGDDVLAEVLGRSLRVANRRLKAATNWAPTHPSLRAGLAAIAAEAADAPTPPGRDASSANSPAHGINEPSGADWVGR